MTDMFCARCDRVRLTNEPNEPDGAAGSIFPGPRPWVSLRGHDVCPQCQTVAERQDAARRIVAAVEAQIARSALQHGEPSSIEPGVIVYAMQLRERLAQISVEGTPPPLERSSTPLRVAVTGAFLTGLPLHLSINKYEQTQNELQDELERRPGRGWSVDTEQWRHEGTYSSGGGFSSTLPLVIARREGADLLARTVDILKHRPKSEQDQLARQTIGWTLTPVSMRVDLYDLGMAVITGTFEVVVPAAVELAAAAGVLKRLVWLKPDPDTGAVSPIVATFRELAHETTQQFRQAIAVAAPHAVQPPWLAPFLRAQPTGRSDAGDWGRLLWLHPVHLLQTADPAAAAAGARALAPPFHRIMAVAGGQFVSGIGWSAVVTDAQSSAIQPYDIDIPLRLLELHWAYIALYMEIDRGLLALLDGEQWRQPRSLTTLEDDADDVFTGYTRVIRARARVESHLAGLGGDEQAMWDVIADVTKYGALVEGVDRKIDVLQRISERRVQQATALFGRRSSAFLSFLTALTIISVAVDLIANFLGSRNDDLGHLPLRVIVVAAALLLGLGLYREAYRQPHHRQRRRRHTSSGENRPGDHQ